MVSLSQSVKVFDVRERRQSSITKLVCLGKVLRIWEVGTFVF